VVSVIQDPYYNYAPTVVLSRPVALIGFMGARVPLTGVNLATITGLPFIDLDRQVEHAAGRSLSRLVHERGVEALAGYERRMLGRALAESPPPIIAMGHATLSDPQTREMVMAGAEVFFIERDINEMYGHLMNELSQAPGRFWPYSHSRPANALAMTPRCMLHEPQYRGAHHHIRAHQRHPRKVAAEILEMLEAADDASG